MEILQEALTFFKDMFPRCKVQESAYSTVNGKDIGISEKGNSTEKESASKALTMYNHKA